MQTKYWPGFNALVHLDGASYVLTLQEDIWSIWHGLLQLQNFPESGNTGRGCIDQTTTL